MSFEDKKIPGIKPLAERLLDNQSTNKAFYKLIKDANQTGAAILYISMNPTLFSNKRIKRELVKYLSTHAKDAYFVFSETDVEKEYLDLLQKYDTNCLLIPRERAKVQYASHPYWPEIIRSDTSSSIRKNFMDIKRAKKINF
jgi:hypothetical protein